LIAGLLLQDAVEVADLRVAFVGHSFRQTKLNMSKVISFCRNLPSARCCVRKTRVTFGNGSSIEAFPNNLIRFVGTRFTGFGGMKPTLRLGIRICMMR
jgi:hypothetical protein